MEQSGSIQTVMGTRTEKGQALDSLSTYFLHKRQGSIHCDYTIAGMLDYEGVI